MSAVLKKITAEAKRIQKRSPRTSWQSAIKQAAAMYMKAKTSGRKVGATMLLEKGETKRTKPKKYVQVKRTKAGTYAGVRRLAGFSSAFGGAMVAGVRKFSMASVRAQVLAEIGKLEAKKFAAKKVSEKKAIQKKLTEKKRLYKKLS